MSAAPYETGWPLLSNGDIFRSGTNRASEIRATFAAGWRVGVSAPELRDDAMLELHRAAYEKLPDGRGKHLLFVDSGALGEMGEEGGRFVVKSPISHPEWQRRLRIYQDLALQWGWRLFAVAPDRIGDQEGTYQRLKRYARRLRFLLEGYGATLIVPLPVGPLELAEQAGRCAALLNRHPNIVWGIPLKKNATPLEQLGLFAKRLQQIGHPHPRFHFLGLAPRSLDWPGRRYLNALCMVRQYLPDAMVTCDSVRLRALAGRTNGPGGGPSPLTAARLEVLAEGVLTDPAEIREESVARTYAAEWDEARETARRLGWYAPGEPGPTPEARASLAWLAETWKEVRVERVREQLDLFGGAY